MCLEPLLQLSISLGCSWLVLLGVTVFEFRVKLSFCFADTHLLVLYFYIHSKPCLYINITVITIISL